MRSLSILIGLGLIARAIYFKPTSKLVCSHDLESCAFLEGKHLVRWEGGTAKSIWRTNLETGKTEHQPTKVFFELQKY